MRLERSQRAITILETIISVTILGLWISTVFTLNNKTQNMLNKSDLKIKEILQKYSWNNREISCSHYAGGYKKGILCANNKFRDVQKLFIVND